MAGFPGRIVYNQPELQRLLESPEGPVGKDLLRRVLKVESAAKRFVPVDKGPLRASIVHHLGRDSRGLFGGVGTSMPYAARIEFGFYGPDSLGRVYNQAAQPYLRPAVLAAADSSFKLSDAQLATNAGFAQRRAKRAAVRSRTSATRRRAGK